MFLKNDRVIYTGKRDGGLHTGDTGTVLEDCKRETQIVSVAWDRNIEGHDCHGMCLTGHGWNVISTWIELIDDDMQDVDPEAFLRLIGGL